MSGERKEIRRWSVTGTDSYNGAGRLGDMRNERLGKNEQNLITYGGDIE